MPFEVVTTNQFKKDLKLCSKRGLNLQLILEVMRILEDTGQLPIKYKPHTLSGNWKGYWECHIQSDWLLIWEQNEVIKLITISRTGTHSDLF